MTPKIFQRSTFSSSKTSKKARSKKSVTPEEQIAQIHEALKINTTILHNLHKSGIICKSSMAYYERKAKAEAKEMLKAVHAKATVPVLEKAVAV